MGVVSTLWSPRWRWLTLAVGWVAVAVLAHAGLATVEPPLSVLDRVYLTPKLFSLGVADELARQDWRIQLARFVGPVIFASTFFAATAAVLRDQVARVRLRFVRDHVVVAGLGDKGARVAASFRAAGHRVVAIERDPVSPEIAPLRRRGVTVVVGDATTPDVLAEAGAARAERLVVVAGRDGTNAEVVAAVRTIRRTGHPLTCAVHLVDPQLTRLLRTRELSGGRDGVRYDFFNIYHRGARRWLAEAAPFVADRRGRPPHLVVVLGDDALGESVAVAAAQRRRADDAAGSLRITIVDADAHRRLQSLRLRHPALVATSQLDSVEIDPERPNPGAVERFEDLLRGGTVTSVFVAIADDTLALSTALAIRQALGTHPATVHVRTRTDAGIAVLVAGHDGDTMPVALQSFGLLDRTCTATEVSGGTNEQVARALHDDYVARTRTEGRTGSAVVGWEELPRDVRESNRLAADDLVAALASVGVGLSPLYGWDSAGFAFTDAETEVLGRREHDRWAAERHRAGWRYGAERDDAAQLNPLLVSWDELPDPARRFNLDAARGLPALLARAGFELTRLGVAEAAASAPTR